MKVLVACEESQRVCTEFRRLGHEAYSCDVQECSGGHPEWHLEIQKPGRKHLLALQKLWQISGAAKVNMCREVEENEQ